MAIVHGLRALAGGLLETPTKDSDHSFFGNLFYLMFNYQLKSTIPIYIHFRNLLLYRVPTGALLGLNLESDR